MAAQYANASTSSSITAEADSSYAFANAGSQSCDNRIVTPSSGFAKTRWQPDGQRPQCLPYHPLSELGTRSGYYPNINDLELSAAESIFRALADENILEAFQESEVVVGDHDFLRILRFLRARKYDIAKSFDMIRADILWRQETKMSKLGDETAATILKCDLNQMYSFFPSWVQGYDRQLRPVAYRQFGKFEVSKVLKLTSMENLVRFHAWESERLIRLSQAKSRVHGFNVETFVLVIDAAGWHMGLASGDAFTFIKGMATTDSFHYPERLGILLLINAPAVLTFAWNIVQNFLDSVTKAKIRIFSSNSDEWKPILFSIVDPDQVPIMYGGTAPDPDPAHPFEF